MIQDQCNWWSSSVDKVDIALYKQRTQDHYEDAYKVRLDHYQLRVAAEEELAMIELEVPRTVPERSLEPKTESTASLRIAHVRASRSGSASPSRANRRRRIRGGRREPHRASLLSGLEKTGTRALI